MLRASYNQIFCSINPSTATKVAPPFMVKFSGALGISIMRKRK